MYKSKYYDERASKTNWLVSLPLGIAGLFFVVFFLYIGIDALGKAVENEQFVERADRYIREGVSYDFEGVKYIGMTDDKPERRHGRVYGFNLKRVFFGDTILKDIVVKAELNEADPYHDAYYGSEDLDRAEEELKYYITRRLTPQEESNRLMRMMDSTLAAY